jgi:hypothetical protein
VFAFFKEIKLHMNICLMCKFNLRFWYGQPNIADTKTLLRAPRVPLAGIYGNPTLLSAHNLIFVFFIPITILFCRNLGNTQGGAGHWSIGELGSLDIPPQPTFQFLGQKRKARFQ